MSFLLTNNLSFVIVYEFINTKVAIVPHYMIFFLQAVMGYTKLDHKKNIEIREHLKVRSVDKEIEEYKINWLKYLQRMNNNRIPLKAFRSKQTVRADRGRPSTCCKDQHLES
jgi:low affinity Fe/Cu permease